MKYILVAFLLLPFCLPAQNSKQLKEKALQKNTAAKWNDVAEYFYHQRTDPKSLKDAADKAMNKAVQEKDKKEQARSYIYLSEFYFQEGNIKNYMSSNKKALSLLNGLKETPLQEEALNNIATAFGEQDNIDSLIFYTRKAIALNKKHKANLSQLGNEYQNMAYAYSIKGLVDSAIYYTKETLAALSAAKDTLRMLDAYNQMGAIYVKYRKYDKALKYFTEALSMYEKVDNKHNRLYIYTNLAAMYQKWGDLKKAIQFSKKAIKDAQNSQEKLTYAKLLCNHGTLLFINKEYNSSIDTLKRSIPHIKSSHHYLGKAYQTLAGNYSFLNKQDSAYYYLALVDSLAAIGQFSRGELFYAAKANILAHQSKYKEAVPYINKFIEIDSKKELKDSYPNIYNMISEVLEKGAGDYKRSLEYKKIASALQDSIYRNESNAKLSEFFALYKTAEKDLEISLLDQKAQKASTYTAIAIASGLFVTILLIAYLFYTKTKQLRKEAKYQDILKQTEIALMTGYLDGLESERARVSKELHDNVANNLFLLEQHLNRLNHIPESVSQQIECIYTHTRNLSHDLMIPSFQYACLPEIMDDYLQEIKERTNITYHLQVDPEEIFENLPAALSHEIYRIVQECMSNIIKHSAARNTCINLLAEENRIVLSIADDGVGFDIRKKTKGIGLTNIRSRCEKLNAQVQIFSEKGKGCEVRVSIPFNPITADVSQ